MEPFELLDYKYEYKDKLLTNRPTLFAVIFKTEEGNFLATSDGKIIVGEEKDMRLVFQKLLVSLVPISPRTTVPMVNIRQHVKGFFHD